MTLAQVEDEIRVKRGEEMLELANPPELRWGLRASLFQPLIPEASPLLLHSYWSANSFLPWHAYTVCVRCDLRNQQHARSPTGAEFHTDNFIRLTFLWLDLEGFGSKLDCGTWNFQNGVNWV
jgi:hypothetical protein